MHSRTVTHVLNSAPPEVGFPGPAERHRGWFGLHCKIFRHPFRLYGRHSDRGPIRPSALGFAVPVVVGFALRHALIEDQRGVRILRQIAERIEQHILLRVVRADDDDDPSRRCGRAHAIRW